MKPFSIIFQRFLTPDSHKGLETGKDETARFILSVNSLCVGELSLEKGMWRFEYSPKFKDQSEVKPLTDFPDVHTAYMSEVLWPFFAFRIPGLKQPRVQQLIQKHNINENSLPDLLKAFGKKSISSPFILQPV